MSLDDSGRGKLPLRPLAILVGVDLGVPNFDSGLEELGLLAQTAGLDPIERITCKRRGTIDSLTELLKHSNYFGDYCLRVFAV